MLVSRPGNFEGEEEVSQPVRLVTGGSGLGHHLQHFLFPFFFFPFFPALRLMIVSFLFGSLEALGVFLCFGWFLLINRTVSCDTFLTETSGLGLTSSCAAGSPSLLFGFWSAQRCSLCCGNGWRRTRAEATERQHLKDRQAVDPGRFPGQRRRAGSERVGLQKRVKGFICSRCFLVGLIRF